MIKTYDINYNIDGSFPNRPSEPRPENLGELSKKVVDYSADFGVGFDGDGDRALIVDEKGNVWWGDVIGALIAMYLKDCGARINSVVTPVTSSSLVDIMLEPLNIKVYRTRVGAKNIVRKMIREASPLGFEENGGIIYAPHVYTRDGGIAMVLIMNLLSYYERPLSTLLRDTPELFQLKDKVKISNKQSISEILTKIEEDLGKDTYKIDRIDGIKLYYSIDRWVLVRPSGTEPIIRIFSEAPSKREAIELVEKAKEIARDYIQ
jgi:phosphomannomutase/phosphoglucomutase